jgi:CheY-like chemotaxis protein
MPHLLRVLVVQDNLLDIVFVLQELRHSGFDIYWRQSRSEEEFIALLNEEFDIVLSDYRFPDTLHALLHLRKRDIDIPFIIISNATSGVKALIENNPFEVDCLSVSQLPLLGVVVERALKQKELRDELRHMQHFTRYLTSMLGAVRSVNRLIIRINDPLKLLADTANILVEICGYSMAWIGLVDEGHKCVLPAARAGEGTDYLDEVPINWDEHDTSQEPTGASIRMRKPITCHQMTTLGQPSSWRKALMARGVKWSVAVPLVNGDRIFGALSVYGNEPKTFCEEEVAILAEMGESLALALMNMENKDRLEQPRHVLTAKKSHRESRVVEISKHGSVRGIK